MTQPTTDQIIEWSINRQTAAANASDRCPYCLRHCSRHRFHGMQCVSCGCSSSIKEFRK